MAARASATMWSPTVFAGGVAPVASSAGLVGLRLCVKVWQQEVAKVWERLIYVPYISHFQHLPAVAALMTRPFRVALPHPPRLNTHVPQCQICSRALRGGEVAHPLSVPMDLPVPRRESLVDVCHFCVGVAWLQQDECLPAASLARLSCACRDWSEASLDQIRKSQPLPIQRN